MDAFGFVCLVPPQQSYTPSTEETLVRLTHRAFEPSGAVLTKQGMVEVQPGLWQLSGSALLTSAGLLILSGSTGPLTSSVICGEGPATATVSCIARFETVQTVYLCHKGGGPVQVRDHKATGLYGVRLGD